MKKRNLVKMSIYTALMANCFTIKPDAPCCRENRAEKSFYADVDYLFWKAEEDQTYYAVKAVGSFDRGFISPTEYDIANQCFEGTSGVRAKAGYYFCDCWDTRIAYTRLNSCNTASVSEPERIFATAIFNLINSLSASSATSTWNAHFQSVDWELAATQEYCDDIFFRPHVGIKWAKIKQTQAITYFDLEASGDFTPSAPALANKFNTFSGAGLRAGVDSQWFFWNDLSVISNISAALLYGKFNVHVDYTITGIINQTPPAETLTPKIVTCKHSLVPTAQMLLGLNWERDCGCTTFDIGIAYEAQYWWNQWQSIPSIIGILVTTAGNGNFTMQGLTANFGIRF